MSGKFSLRCQKFYKGTRKKTIFFFLGWKNQTDIPEAKKQNENDSTFTSYGTEHGCKANSFILTYASVHSSNIYWPHTKRLLDFNLPKRTLGESTSRERKNN